MEQGNRPNIVFILTDQMRFDCLGILGHPVVQTPHLDQLAREGTVFTSAYSVCPSCIAARASIFTGLRPTTHGRLGYRDKIPWRYENTLAEVFREGGYQTHCVGKRHFYPQMLPLGFETLDTYEAIQDFGDGYVNDYFEWLKERTGVQERDSGLSSNSWVGGVSALPEEWHNNSWVASMGIDFLKKRDPNRPFFLNLSFHRPHAPLDPPADYLAMYEDVPIPPVPVGEWAGRHAVPVTDRDAWQGKLSKEQIDQGRRSYYALITHIDAQIGRFRHELDKLDVGPSWFLFTSDHGEMLGDHNLFRKTYAYEGSAGIPMIITPPETPGQRRAEAPVSQIDIMPTLLEAAGLEIPKHVEGRSMLSLLNNASADVKWRDYVHGEHSACYDKTMGMQFLTDGKEKYIWYTLSGEEQLFNLVDDPDECHNRANDPKSKVCLLCWRSRLISELSDRPEDGMSDGKDLISGVTLPPVRSSLHSG